MTRRYGIDTPVLMRLITGAPPDAVAHCVKRLSALACLSHHPRRSKHVRKGRVS